MLTQKVQTKVQLTTPDKSIDVLVAGIQGPVYDRSVTLMITEGNSIRKELLTAGSDPLNLYDGQIQVANRQKGGQRVSLIYTFPRNYQIDRNVPEK